MRFTWDQAAIGAKEGGRPPPPYTAPQRQRKSNGGGGETGARRAASALGDGGRLGRRRRGGGGGGPSRADRSRAESLPTVIPRSERAAPQPLCKASPVLNRKLRIYRGRRERRGEEREAEAEGAGSPAGQGGGGRPGGAGAAPGGRLHVFPRTAALRFPYLCSGSGRCVAKGRFPPHPLGLPRSRVRGGGPLP